MLTVPLQRTVGRYLLLAVAGALAALGLQQVWTERVHFARYLDIASSWNGNGPILNVGVDNCWELENDSAEHQLICRLDPLRTQDSQRVRIIVRDQTDAELRVETHGCTVSTCNENATVTPDASPAGRCRDILFDGLPDHAEARLRLFMNGQPQGQRLVRFVVAPRTALDDLRARWQAAAPAGPEAVQALIPQAMSLFSAQPPGPLRDRAQILLALIVNDRYRLLEEQQEFLSEKDAANCIARLEPALQLAHARRWLRSEAELSQALTWRYAKSRSSQVAAIEKLLADQEWLQLLPAQKIHCYRLFIDAAGARQDVRRVERQLDELLHEAELLNDQHLFSAYWELRAAYLENNIIIGSNIEIEKGLLDLEAAANQASWDPCGQAYLWGSLGWMKLSLLERGRLVAEGPIPALQRAIALRTNLCRKSRASLANLWANMARAHSAAWWHWAELDPTKRSAVVQSTRAALAEMQAALGPESESDSMRMDRLLSEVRIYLFAGAPLKSFALFDELLHLAESSSSPLENWLVKVHKAEALAASGQRDQAIATFRQADEHLMTLLQHVPIFQSHRLILSRFAHSSQRAIELYLRDGRTAEALEVLRQFDQRALGLTSRPWWSEQPELLNAQWQRRRKEQARYQLKRLDYEKSIAEARDYDLPKCQELARVKSDWLTSLDTLYAEPPPQGFPPPALARGELLLGCARQQSGWVCLSALDGAHQAVPIAAPDLDAHAVEQIVLPALASWIRQAREIRVLAHGELAQIDLGALTFDGNPLGGQKPIRCSVDRPPGPSPSPIRQALLVFNPENNISEFALAPTERWLTPSLSGLRVINLGVSAPGSTPSGWTRGEALGPGLMSALPSSDVFVYFGHVRPMPCPAGTECCTDDPRSPLSADARLTSLQLSQSNALSTADVLMAERVPQRVFLLGCESADRSASTPAEMLGLAQAFALRGSQVLAFARTVEAQTALEVLCALGQQRLSDPSFDLGRFVMDAQRRFASGELCQAQGKWYLPACRKSGTCPASPASPASIDWKALRWYAP